MSEPAAEPDGRPSDRPGLADWAAGPVVVRTPATSANLGPGFDSLGLALALHDEVEARVTPSGLRIEVSGFGEHTARLGERHLVVRAMRAVFSALGEQPPGLAVRCVNAIPHGFGLGSSAAAIVAGMLAARALAGPRGAGLPDEAVLGLAAGFEGHADNVAACLAGGLTIAWSEPPSGRLDQATGGAGTGAAAGGPVRSLRLEPMPGLIPVLCVPAVPLATQTARQVLPAIIPHADAARNAARSALLVAAMTGPPAAGPGARAAALLLDATRDFLHQPYRAAWMPASAALIAGLRDRGIPAVISGAGPAVLALLVPGAAASPADVRAVARSSGKAWDVRVLDLDRAGATVRLAADAGGNLLALGANKLPRSSRCPGAAAVVGRYSGRRRCSGRPMVRRRGSGGGAGPRAARPGRRRPPRAAAERRCRPGR